MQEATKQDTIIAKRNGNKTEKCSMDDKHTVFTALPHSEFLSVYPTWLKNVITKTNSVIILNVYCIFPF